MNTAVVTRGRANSSALIEDEVPPFHPDHLNDDDVDTNDSSDAAEGARSMVPGPDSSETYDTIANCSD